MKKIILLLTLLSFFATSQSQSFMAEREKDIHKFTEHMNRIEPAYLQHNTRVVKRDLKNLTRIMTREIERTGEDLAKMKHALYGGTGDKNTKINVTILTNRLNTMEYIKQRVVGFDLGTLYEYSKRELSGFKSGLNYFKTLMEYNYSPSLAIHRIPANAKWIRTPAEDKSQE